MEVTKVKENKFGNQNALGKKLDSNPKLTNNSTVIGYQVFSLLKLLRYF